MSSIQKPQLAMVCAGAVSRTTAGTHPNILDRLGPVKAASLRVASRVVNAIRAGVPVSAYEDLTPAQTIIISAPDAEVESLIAELGAASLRWKHKTVLLADSKLDSVILANLAAAGAATGSFNVLKEFGARKVLAEGDAKAVRTIRTLLETSHCKVLQIEAATKARYFAAADFLEFSLTSMLVAGAEALRRAGVRSIDARSILESASNDAIRTYLKAGKNALSNIETGTFHRLLTALQNRDADLAEYYMELLSAAKRFRPDFM